MTTPNDSDLSRLLDDAVSDVHPEGDSEQIRSRARRPSAVRWVPVTLAAAAATAVVIGGTAWLAQQQPANDAPAAGPGPNEAPTSQSPAEQPRTVDTTVYYVGATANGFRLFPETRRVADATGTDLQVAIDQVMADRALDPDYRGWPPDDTTAKATQGEREITIDLSAPAGETANLADGMGERIVQALVWTAATATGTDLPVRFLVDGEPVDSLLGADTSTPVQRAGEDSVFAPVLVESLTQGATVQPTFTVTGRAATFEANVVWELKRGQETVRNGFTTAEVCCTLAPYSFEVTAPPGEYTLVVHDTDESDGEGVGVSQDTKDIVVVE